MVLHPQLQAVKQVEVVQAAQCEVVWPLLAVGAQHKRAAVGLVAEELQGRLATCLKGLDVGVFACEGVGIQLQGWEKGVREVSGGRGQKGRSVLCTLQNRQGCCFAGRGCATAMPTAAVIHLLQEPCSKTTSVNAQGQHTGQPGAAAQLL